MYHPIDHCRVCGGTALEPVLNLGMQAMTGVFPRTRDAAVDRGPLELVRCAGANADACGLVQLRHRFDAGSMYGATYGYRSGLNRGMVRHLQETVAGLTRIVSPGVSDVVLDIGANDGTTLGFYPPGRATLIGIDPSAEKFRHHYRDDVQVVVDFFTAAAFLTASGGRKAKLVTSIAMFYDLDDPQAFVDDIAAVLTDDGVWHFEQSYLPAMLAATAYDTICHEHAEYYALRQIQFMLGRSGLVVLDVSLNDTNGGSFAVTAAKRGGPRAANDTAVAAFERAEQVLNLHRPDAYDAFCRRVHEHPQALHDALDRRRRAGKRVLGYGASTKGNVMLQYCNMSESDLPCIAEVNEDKFGSFTPGTRIPIVSEADAKATKPDTFLVLPWHFREGIVAREAAFLADGGELLFPLPQVRPVGG